MHNPGVLLRDIRNIKKNNTLILPMTSKDIGSAKDLKKARSSQQLINLKGFLDNKNDKIKTIDQKLEVHQSEIQRNGAIIQELTNTLLTLKGQFSIEKEKLESEEKKNKQLRQQIQRTNKLLKSKNLKIDELSKKIQSTEKQMENLKPYQQKTQELTKINNQIRKQMTRLQESLGDKKNLLNDQTKQTEKLKQKIGELGGLKGECQKLKSMIRIKDNDIEQLNQRLNYLEKQNQGSRARNNQQLHRLHKELRQYSQRLRDKQIQLSQAKSNEKKSEDKVFRLESEIKILRSEAQGKETFSQTLRKQLNQLKSKFQSVNTQMLKKENEDKSKVQKISVMKEKMEELQRKLDNQTAEKLKLKPYEQKLQSLNKRSKKLEELYKLMVPQIQCPYGHELNNPITVIPCGHNYCLGCKKGYAKECMLCNGKLKIEAVYRNQLMDDIINIVNGISKVLQMIR